MVTTACVQTLRYIYSESAGRQYERPLFRFPVRRFAAARPQDRCGYWCNFD